jgi:hypothetical protein
MVPRLRATHVCLFALACAVAVARGGEPAPKPHSVTKVYAVADLVVPIPDCTNCPLTSPKCATACVASSPITMATPAAKCCAIDPQTGAAEIGCDFEIMCHQEEPCRHQAGCCHAMPSCCPDGPCCPNGPCCKQAGCCQAAAPSCCPNGPCCPDGPCCKGQACCAPSKCDAPKAAATPNEHDRLIKLITTTVCPECWAARGGCCTIDYMPIGMAVVVNAPPDVQERVADLLESLRHLQDMQVAVEMKVVSIADGPAWEKLCADVAVHDHMTGTSFAGGQPVFLTDRQVAWMIEQVQGDRGTNVMHAPKLTIFNGQRASIRCTEDRFFVTSVNAVKFKDQTVFVPVNTPMSLGSHMTIRPTVSADRRFVRCELAVQQSGMASATVPLFPVTTYITPTFEGGAQGQPIPFTQFIQQPSIARNDIEKTLTIADGGTAMLYAGKRTRAEAPPEGAEPTAPFFDWIYDLVDLFCTPPEPTMIDEHVVILVTPRVIRTDSAEMKAAAAPRPMPIGPYQAAGILSADLAMPICPCPPADFRAAGAYMPIRPCGATAPVAEVAPPQIQMNTTILSVEPEFWSRADAAGWSQLSPTACQGQPRFISPDQAQKFVKAVCERHAGTVESQPRLMCLDGQTAEVCIRQAADAMFRVSVTPRTSADCRFVRVALAAEKSGNCRQEAQTAAACPPGMCIVTHMASGGPSKTDTVLMMVPQIVRAPGDPILPPTCAACPGTPRSCAAMADAPPIMPCPTAACCPTCAQPGQCCMVPQQCAAPTPTGRQILLDATVLTMDPAAWEQPVASAWQDFSPKSCDGKTKVISPEEAQRFCKAMKAQSAGKLMAEPKIVTLDGQRAVFMTGGQQACTTGLSLVAKPDGSVSPEFNTKYQPLGTRMTFVATDRPDGLHLRCECEMSTAAGGEKEYKVTIESPDEAPRTETLRWRSTNVQQMSFTSCLPCGRTLLMHCGRNAEGQDVVMMVTPHVVNPAPAAVMVPPPPLPPYCPAPSCSPTAYLPVPVVTSAILPAAACDAVPAPAAGTSSLSYFMAMYRQACVGGDTAKARIWAEKCMALDPTCFGK